MNRLTCPPTHQTPQAKARAHRLARAVCASVALIAPFMACAQTAAKGATGLGSWQFGAVIDAAQMGAALPLGLRDSGLGLGHSDLLARGTLGSQLSAEGIVAVATHEGRTEMGVEKLFVQTRSLPAGLQVRAGRFASQVGYLNEQHPHADDFVERPLLYRGFLGHHYFDDGLRLNWTAPTPFYLQLGAEAFGGRKLSPQGREHMPTGAGVSTFSLKLGSDLGAHQAWQAGVARLVNRRAAAQAHLDEGPAEHTLHGDAHGAAFAGRHLDLFDLTWKWAPNGNAREQQWRVVLEKAHLSSLPEPVLQGRRHEGQSISVVWRFRPAWEAGVRVDQLRAAFAHEDHFDAAELEEHSAMVVYKPSHKQSLRLQWTTARKAQGFEVGSRPVWALHYVVAFGAHGAHNF